MRGRRKTGKMPATLRACAVYRLLAGQPADAWVKPCCHTRPRMRQPLLTSAPAVRNARNEYIIFVSSWFPCGLYTDKAAGTVSCCPPPIRITRWARDVFCFLVSPALARAGDTSVRKPIGVEKQTAFSSSSFLSDQTKRTDLCFCAVICPLIDQYRFSFICTTRVGILPPGRFYSDKITLT